MKRLTLSAKVTKIKGIMSCLFRKGEISKKYIAKHLSDDPIVLEAGAHIGRDTIEMSRMWPKGTVHAFEPVTDIYNQLCATVQNCSNVRTYQLALGGKSEKRKIYISSGNSNASSSLLKPKEHLMDHPDVEFIKEEIVEVVSLLEWKNKYQINKIDFLWLDLQGNELDVLKAAEILLPTIKVIYTEVNLKENYENAGLYSDLKQYLERLGFRVVKEKLPWADAGNVLFVNSII